LAGNTLTDAGAQTYVYDGENKMVKASNGSGTLGEYFYDGDGKRVKKIAANDGGTTIFVYDAAGKLVAEYSQTAASVEDAKVAYLTNDHLGSPRINTDRDGNVTARHDYHPFGEEITTTQRTGHSDYTPDSIRKQFTGYERDNETDLDFAEARMYSGTLGRFTTTDPVYMKDQRLTDPQQLNTYIYVRNNPLNYADPSGLSPDITVDGKEKDWAVDKIKEGVSFANVIGVNEQGKLAISDGKGGYLDPNKTADKALLDVMGNALKDDKDFALFKAITDPTTHATLTASKSDNTVDVGGSVSPGKNIVDRNEAEMIQNAGKGKAGTVTAADIVKHEAMEAYGTAKTGKTILENPGPHTNNPYTPLLVVPGTEKISGNGKEASLTVTTAKAGGTYIWTKTLDGGSNPRTGNIKKVTFKPDKK